MIASIRGKKTARISCHNFETIPAFPPLPLKQFLLRHSPSINISIYFLRLAIPAFFRFTDVTELMIGITILYVMKRQYTLL